MFSFILDVSISTKKNACYVFTDNVVSLFNFCDLFLNDVENMTTHVSLKNKKCAHCTLNIIVIIISIQIGKD